MKTIDACLITLLLLAISFLGFSQKLLPAKSVKMVDTSFNQLIKHFDQRNPFRKDTLKLPVLLTDKDYQVVLADSDLHLVKQRRVLTNPFSADNYPLSYSVLYQNNLISLFWPGYFACFNIDTWQRNLPLEKRLNSKRFERHWLVEGQLVGLAANQYWHLTPKQGWQPYSKLIPFKERPKLFEDATYLVYNECKGEFGGQIFFFNKHTQKIYWTPSTCAVWVRHTSVGYEVVSSLGHGGGSADAQLVRSPDLLPEWTGKPTNAVVSNDATRPITLFDMYNIQLFGGLERAHQLLYLVYISERTCLASLSGYSFTIVDALFNDGLYTHQPVTTNYDGVYLINLDFYGIGRYQEVSCLILKNNQATLLDWHELHPRY